VQRPAHLRGIASGTESDSARPARDCPLVLRQLEARSERAQSTRSLG